MYRKVLLLIVFILYLILSLLPFETLNISKPRIVTVEVKGEVENECVIELPLGSCFDDLLKHIELKDDADISFFSLSETLYNREIIVIPKKTVNELKISLNSATLNELMLLPGIGEVTANRIIEYRKEHSFHSIEEIKNINGIGDKRFEKIKQYLTI